MLRTQRGHIPIKNHPPMSTSQEHSQQALINARHAYQKGEHLKARFWAQRAAALAPDDEEVWLWLAAVSSPRASVRYLERALQIAPDSKRARKGMHWAVKRLRESPPPPPALIPASHSYGTMQLALPVSQTVAPARGLQFNTLQWTLILLIVGMLLIAVSVQPLKSALTIILPLMQPATETEQAPSFTDTPLPSHTPTETSSPTPTPTDTLTPTPTDTVTPIPTDTPLPTYTDTPVPYDPLPVNAPDVNRHERWVDVDLTQQRVYAYEGSTLIQSFIASTGTWQHPTVTGQYTIYVKYESAPMSGPDYYLPGVPYIMYFYKGYALHGTYWHDNFGTPMSHGCVNLRTPDAEWLFYWASIGTVVNIHY